MRGKKRFLSLLLTLALVFSMTPTAAFAVDMSDGDTSTGIVENIGDTTQGSQDEVQLPGDDGSDDLDDGSESDDTNQDNENPGDVMEPGDDSDEQETVPPVEGTPGDETPGDDITGEEIPGDESNVPEVPTDELPGDGLPPVEEEVPPTDEELGIAPIVDVDEFGSITLWIASSGNGGSDVSGTGDVDTPLMTVSNAIEVAREAGATHVEINMASDIELSRTLTLDDTDMTVTINGNDYSLIYTGQQVIGSGTGLVEVVDGADVTFHNVALTRMTGSTYAACLLYVQNATALLDDVELLDGYNGNHTVDDGGSALYVASGAEVTMANNTLVRDNKPVGSSTSGAVFVQEAGHLTITGAEIRGNGDALYGDGIYVQDGGELDIYSEGNVISVEDEIYLEAGSSATVGAADGQSGNVTLSYVFLETEPTDTKLMATLDISGETTASDINIEVDLDNGEFDPADFEHFPYRLISAEAGYEINNVMGEKDETGWEDNCGLWDIRYMVYNGVPGLYFYYYTIDATFHDVRTLTGIIGTDINGEEASLYNPEEIENSTVSEGLLTIPEFVALQDGDFEFTFTADESNKVYRIPTPDQVVITVDNDRTLVENRDYIYTPDYENGTATLIVYSSALKDVTDHIHFEISAEKYYLLTLVMNGPLYTMKTDITGLAVTSTLNVVEEVAANGTAVTYRIERNGVPVPNVTVALYQESLVTDPDDAPVLSGKKDEQTTNEDGYAYFTGLDGKYSYYPILYYSESFYVIERDKVDVTLSVLEGQKMDDRYDYEETESTVTYNPADSENWNLASSLITGVHPADGQTSVIYYVRLAQDVIRFHANQGDATTADTATYYFNHNTITNTDVFQKSMEAAAETYGSLPDMTMVGYDFVGWFTEPVGGEQVFEDTLYDTVNSPKDLYAHWTPQNVGYKVEHWVELSPIHIDLVHEDANPGYEQGVTPTKEANGKTYYLWSSDTLKDVDDDIADTTIEDLYHRALTDMSVAHADYTWWTLDGFTIVPDTNAFVEADGSSVFSIYYDRNVYTITFDPGEGGAHMNTDRTTQDAKFGGDAGSDMTDRLPGLLTASRPGYVFGGWYYNLGTPEEVLVTTTSWYSWTHDITVEAKWLQADTTYTIKIATEDMSYDAEGLGYADGTYTLYKTVPGMVGTSDETMTVSVHDYESLKVPGFTFIGYKMGLSSDDLNSFDQSGSGMTPAGEDDSFTFAPNEYGTTVVYLFYERNSASLTFWDDTADSSPDIFDQVDVVYGDEFDEALPETNPTKPGYDFSGWVDGDGNAITADTPTDGYTSNGSVSLDIYPAWTARQYFITYVPGQGATFDVSSLDTSYKINSNVVGGYIVESPVTYNEKMGDMPTASKPGYEFLGWMLTEGPCVDTYVTEDTVVTVDNVVVLNENNTMETTRPLYAQYEPYWFNLTLDPGAGHIADGGPSQVQVTYGQPIPELPEAEREGYIFVGWVLDTEDAAGTRIESGDVWTYLTTNHATVTATAVYVPEKYTFTFDLNDASSGNGSTYATLFDTTQSSVDIEFGGPFAEIVNGIVAHRNGYLFVGWSTDYTQENIIDDEAILNTIPDSTVLHAIWKPIVTEMRVYTGGGDWQITNEPSYNDYAAAYYEPYEAEWNVTMEATLNNDEGYWSVPLIFDTVYGDIGTPVRDNGQYDFQGWLAYAPNWYNGSELVIHGQIVEGIYVPFTDHLDSYIEMHAMWDAHMTFIIPDEGMSAGAQFEDYSGSTVLVSKDELEAAGELPNVIKDGYVLYGWYDINEERFVTLTEVLGMDTHHTFEAVMTPVVTFNGNGGQVIAAGGLHDVYQIGLRNLIEQYGQFFTATKSGVTFIGWSEVVDGNASADLTTLENIRYRTTPITLNAVYDVQVTFVIPMGAYWDNDKTMANKTISVTEIRTWSALPTVTLPGYNFLGWYDEDLEAVSLGELAMLSESATVYAYFQISGGEPEPGDEYTITVTTNDSNMGSVTVLPDTTAAQGEEITLVVTPIEGVNYTVGVTGPSGVITPSENEDGNLVFTMPNGNVTVSVTFRTEGEVTDNINIIVTDYTTGDATWTEPVDGWVAGTNQFFVACDEPCAVALVRDEVASELSCVAVEGGYLFTADGLVDGDEIVIVKRGDADLDGTVRAIDATRVAQSLIDMYEFTGRECVQMLAADADRDGTLRAIDATRIAQSLIGLYDLTWNLSE